jgi:F420-dependent oxidoreductase-like protein
VHVRIGIQASYSGGFQETAAEIRDLEAAGLDVALVSEVYTFDAVSQLGYLAAVTERVDLMSAIFPIYSRTPTLTAMTAAGLDYVSNGRFILGLGASGPQVIEGWHGVPYDAPLQRTREVVEICRQVWRRERVVHEGPKYFVPLPAEQGTGLGKPLKLINTPVRERVPVMLAALGPKNVELAAEIAEAWQPIWFQPEKAGDVWGESLAAGKAKRDPSLGALQVVVGVPVAIGDDVDQLHDQVRPHLALYVGGMGARGKNFYNDLTCRYGYEAAAKEVQDLYLSGKKDEAAAS